MLDNRNKIISLIVLFGIALYFVVIMNLNCYFAGILITVDVIFFVLCLSYILDSTQKKVEKKN